VEPRGLEHLTPCLQSALPTGGQGATSPKRLRRARKDWGDGSEKRIRRGRAAGRGQQNGDLPGPVRDAGRDSFLAHPRDQDGRRGLAGHRESLIDRDKWTPPPQRKIAEAKRVREASYNTVKTFAERYLRERRLGPTTVHNYQRLLSSRIHPYFAEMPVKDVTLSEIKAWRASLNPKTEATNAAAYRLLRSLLQAAEEEELIDRAPPKIRGAGASGACPHCGRVISAPKTASGVRDRPRPASIPADAP
jgi:Phage integrase, N-terminal SAM-like domain